MAAAFKPRLSTPATGVVITGAASGFGYAAAQALAAVGRPVALWDSDAARVAAAAEAIHATFGVPAIGLALNLCRPHAIVAAAEQTRTALPGIGAIVHAEGVVDHGALEGADLESWTLGINTNLRPLLVLAQVFLNDLGQQSGSAIVAFSALGCAPGGGGNPIYSAAAGGVPSLVRALAHHLKRDGIRVNAVAARQDPTTAAGMEEAACVVRFLLSYEARGINAQECVVGG
ncbi:MAG: SDR family oxidoreductase [Nevskiaceae bacterium]|nr:MAG: SDR family oxidoreductase [Nevskiaceae bacterium]TBR74258.1 MAG: SDR family oxidoreductase [Nevskiaceae bacterium]